MKMQLLFRLSIRSRPLPYGKLVAVFMRMALHSLQRIDVLFSSAEGIRISCSIN